VKIYKNKKAYIVATFFGLSLIIIVPSVSFAARIYDRQAGMMRSGMQIALFKPHMAENKSHFGLVSGTEGASFNIKNFKVNTNANTSFKKDGVTSTLGEVRDGQHVVVRGLTSASNNTIEAQSVNIITHKPTMDGLKHVFNKQK
jgi:hypothetical protein